MSRTIFRARSSEGPKPVVLEFETGDVVFEEGDIGTEMYILQTGRVEVSSDSEGERRVLAVLEKGDFFGEMAILEGLPRNATTTVLESTRALEISGSTFGQMLVDNPEIAIRMMRKLSRRLRHADQRLLEAGVLERWSESPVSDGTKEAEPSSHYLVHGETGEKFPLSTRGETTIGRRDPVTGINPDVDLTEVDAERSTSRRHAVIREEKGRFFVAEEIGTTNGTYLGKERLRTEVPTEITDGQPLQVGLVELAFRAAS